MCWICHQYADVPSTIKAVNYHPDFFYFYRVKLKEKSGVVELKETKIESTAPVENWVIRNYLTVLHLFKWLINDMVTSFGCKD